MTLRNQLASIIAVALLAACGKQTSTAQPMAAVKASSAPTVAVLGKAAPDFSEPTSTGDTLTLASLKGKAVYLNFFATWCGPCNDEASDLNALQRKYGLRGLQVVGVDVLENAKKAEDFRVEHKLLYPAVVDPGTLRDSYNVNGLPVHVFIDRVGVVRKIEIGELSSAEMDADVRAIL